MVVVGVEEGAESGVILTVGARSGAEVGTGAKGGVDAVSGAGEAMEGSKLGKSESAIGYCPTSVKLEGEIYLNPPTWL